MAADTTRSERLVARLQPRCGDLLPTDTRRGADRPRLPRDRGRPVLRPRSWDTDAAWLDFVAGIYDESHAHQDQGAFTFFRDDWLAVTSNIWSHSGLEGNGFNGNLGVEANNVVRFEKGAPGLNADVIEQSYPSSSSMTPETLPDGTVKIKANLNGAYSTRSSDVKEWKRDLEFQGNRLRVQDTCKVGTGVRAIFQLHVRARPVINPDGSVTAGSLRVQPGAGTQVDLVDMKIYKRTIVEEPEEGKKVTRIVDVFNEGWRIDITNPAGCSFDVSMTAGS